MQRLLWGLRSISRHRICLWQIKRELCQRRLRRFFYWLRPSSLGVYLSEGLIRLLSIGCLFLRVRTCFKSGLIQWRGSNGEVRHLSILIALIRSRLVKRHASIRVLIETLLTRVLIVSLVTGSSVVKRGRGHLRRRLLEETGVVAFLLIVAVWVDTAVLLKWSLAWRWLCDGSHRRWSSRKTNLTRWIHRELLALRTRWWLLERHVDVTWKPWAFW